MVQLALVAGFIGIIGSAIVMGIYGSRYIDRKLRYHESIIRTDQPIVLSTKHPPIRFEDVQKSDNKARGILVQR